MYKTTAANSKITVTLKATTTSTTLLATQQYSTSSELTTTSSSWTNTSTPPPLQQHLKLPPLTWRYTPLHRLVLSPTFFDPKLKSPSFTESHRLSSLAIATFPTYLTFLTNVGAFNLVMHRQHWSPLFTHLKIHTHVIPTHKQSLLH